jgi:serine/threonine protein kinase
VTDRYAQYRVERTLGRGATSEVYLAVVAGEHGFEPRVAVKCLRPDARDEVQIDRFIAEVQVTCHLRHPNVVSTIDFGVLDGTPFSVMEYVEGASVLELLQLARSRRENVPPAIALHIVREVAVALDYVHHATDAKGAPLRIVHRDIGPQNILVATTGHVKLADFSVARAFRRPRLTRVGQVRGTLDFMAPEQLKMEQITSQSDLFGLGCVLHALLVGESPMGSDVQRNEVVTGGEAPVDPTIDSDIQAIIRRAIRVRPKDRFQSAAVMADACWAALRDRADREPRLQTASWITSLERTETPFADAAPRTKLIRLASNTDGVRMFTAKQPRAHDLDETKHLGKIPGLDRTTDLKPIGPGMGDGPTSLIAPESKPQLDAIVAEDIVDPVLGGPTLSEPLDEPRRSMRGPAVAMMLGVVLGGIIALALVPGHWLGLSDPPSVASAPPTTQELMRRIEALRSRNQPALASRLTELERRLATGDAAERRAVATALTTIEREVTP